MLIPAPDQQVCCSLQDLFQPSHMCLLLIKHEFILRHCLIEDVSHQTELGHI